MFIQILSMLFDIAASDIPSLHIRKSAPKVLDSVKGTNPTFGDRRCRRIIF